MAKQFLSNILSQNLLRRHSFLYSAHGSWEKQYDIIFLVIRLNRQYIHILSSLSSSWAAPIMIGDHGLPSHTIIGTLVCVAYSHGERIVNSIKGFINEATFLSGN